MRGLTEAFARLDRYVEQQMEVCGIPGMAVAITDSERLLRTSTHGFADVAARLEVTPNTLFEIGSIGKSFTAIALLQLQEEGRLSVHDPVTSYLPWFAVRSEFDAITLHHLMTHTAGITGGPELPGEARAEVWGLRDTAATAAPGTYYHYSDSGYKTLGVVLEELLGQPYGQIIQARILDPLGMTETEPVVTNQTRTRLAIGYESFYDDRPPPIGFPLAPATWLEHAEGAGSLASTPADMATYVRMLLNRGQGPNRRIIAEESFELLIQRAIKADEEGEGSFYGYGLVIDDCCGHTVVRHSGSMPGYRAYMAADLDDGVGVVVLSNGPVGSADEDIAKLALELLRSSFDDHELPAVPPRRDPANVANAADYVGAYVRVPDAEAGIEQDGGPPQFDIEADAEQLLLHVDDRRVVLEQRGTDVFYANHPDLALFLLRFGRQDGTVVEAIHGSDWYVNSPNTASRAFDYPAELRSYLGHYRSHNPWLSNFRVVLRKGELVLIEPPGEEEPMAPLGGTEFRVGADDRSPERIKFGAIIDGKALRAALSSGEYFRTFTR